MYDWDMERCRRVLLQLDALHLDGNGEELGALAYIDDCGQDKQKRFLVQTVDGCIV